MIEGVAFRNGRELAEAIRKLPRTQDCLLRNLFRYAAGHREAPADEPALAAWTRAFETSGRQLAKFLPEMAAGDAFRTVSPVP